MTFDLGFPQKIILTVGIIFGIALYPLLTYGDRDILHGVIIGCIISMVNVLLGYVAVEYAFDKSNKTFLKVILGGMGVRLIATAGAVLVLIAYYEYHIPSLVVSLFVFYFLFLFYEIMFYNKKLSLKKSTQ